MKLMEAILTSDTKAYRERHGLEIGKPSKFYIVACPFCGAAVGKPCHEKINPERYKLPHSGRIAGAKEKMKEEA
jgi:hypothetical protein